MFRVSTTPIFRNIQNCNCSLRYCAATSLQRGQARPSLAKLELYNCPMRCNTKQSIYYSGSSLYMFRVSNTSIFRSTQNCNYSLRYCATTSIQRGQVRPSLTTLELYNCPKKCKTKQSIFYSGSSLYIF